MKLSEYVDSLGVEEDYHIAPHCPRCGPAGAGLPVCATRPLGPGESERHLQCVACGDVWEGELNEVRAAWIGRLSWEMTEAWKEGQRAQGPISPGVLVEVDGECYVATSKAHDYGGAVGFAFRGKLVTAFTPSGPITESESTAVSAQSYSLINRLRECG